MCLMCVLFVLNTFLFVACVVPFVFGLNCSFARFASCELLVMFVVFVLFVVFFRA